jgi:hypothetical protein
MGRRLRQHGGQERWEVVGVYDLGPRKAYAIEQLILQRFDGCRLNAAGEYLKLTDGQLQELLQIVSEATSKRAEVKTPQPPAPAPGPRKPAPWPTPEPKAEPTPEPTPEPSNPFATLAGFLIVVGFVSGIVNSCNESTRQPSGLPVSVPAAIEAPKPVTAQPATPATEGPSEQWLAEKRANDQRIAERRETLEQFEARLLGDRRKRDAEAKAQYEQGVRKRAAEAAEWLKLNPACERNWQGSYGLCQQALNAVRQAVDLARPKTISVDLARIKAQRRAEPVVLQPMPLPVAPVLQ